MEKTRRIFILFIVLFSFIYGNSETEKNALEKINIFRQNEIRYLNLIQQKNAIHFSCYYDKIHNRRHTPFDYNNTRVLEDIANDLNRLDDITAMAIMSVCSKHYVTSQHYNKLKEEIKESEINYNNSLSDCIKAIEMDGQGIEIFTLMFWKKIIEFGEAPKSAKQILKDFEIRHNLLEKFPID